MALELGTDAEDAACRAVLAGGPDGSRADPCSRAFALAFDLAQAP